MFFRFRVFRDHVNNLASKGSKWVRVHRVYRDLNPVTFSRLVEYVYDHGVVKRMRAYGSVYYAMYREVVMSLDELKRVVGDEVVRKILEG
jgi:allantoicase